jgi:ABC-type sugar transport system substrate-binding protein
VLVVTVDDFPIIKFAGDHIIAHIEENCPDCEVTRLNQATADIATNTPANVVSALQQNPDITHVYFAFGDLSRGVAPAIAEAGIDVKIFGSQPVDENFARIPTGEEAAWVAWPTVLLGWGMVDALARFYGDEDMSVADNAPMTIQIFSQDNPPVLNPESGLAEFPENYPDLYAELWQAS